MYIRGNQKLYTEVVEILSIPYMYIYSKHQVNMSIGSAIPVGNGTTSEEI